MYNSAAQSIMDSTTIGILAAVVNVAIVYFGINKYHLKFTSMLGVLVAVGVIGTLLTREISPPSKTLKKALRAIRTGHQTSFDIEMIVALIGVIVSAVLLWRAYGPLKWLAIVILTSIAAMAVEFV